MNEPHSYDAATLSFGLAFVSLVLVRSLCQ
jgi:hypothetical protein